MLRRFALTGDVSESCARAEEECGEDLIDEMDLEVDFKFGVSRFGVKAIEVLVDMRRRFDTGESCVVTVGIKLLPNLLDLCTCEWHPSENTIKY